MSKHKLTLLGHPARKKINAFLQTRRERITQSSRRLAYGDGVMGISGQDGIDLARENHGVDLNDQRWLEQFNAMLQSYGYRQSLSRTADKCAEAHLWMTLLALHMRSYGESGRSPRHAHPHPRHVHVWVYEIDRKNRVKEDSPCENCRQWVRSEFASVNGTSKAYG